ncbi:protein kinase domain-containing protein [Nocardia nepalensis]|uniref:protein kinase domain-containing protein n=1 Tax=Nocardia nepalensis TaxID=3375448 RepID=UPI003B66C80B
MRTVSDPAGTERNSMAGIEAELDAEGFEGAQVIGRGGFGTVYRCLERALDRRVAVKVLRSDTGPGDLDRFLREQRALGALSGHPNIVTVLHADITVTGRPYLAMPYHPRGSLAQILSTRGPLTLADTLRLGVQLAGALETAHRNGILHRDVKPANVLISDYGEAQLCDFGIAHAAGGFETGTGEITGSPAFTAPEVLSGRASTVRSDIYSLGATLFTLLTGHAAFERLEGEDVVAQFIRIGRAGAPSMSEIPPEAAPVIASAMATRPQDRPASAHEFGTSLRKLQHRLGLPIADMGLAADAPRSSPAQRNASPPAPTTRFRPPRPSDALVRRPRLIESAELPARKRLTLICAPAGFGKTSAATQLAQQLQQNGAHVAWLAADVDDDNPVTFCTHILAALNRAEPGLGAGLQPVLEEAGTGAERYVLGCLINEIHERAGQLALVVEDWHLVTGEATHAALRFMLDKGCHHLQWILTSRTTSGLPLGTLRVRGELAEIDSTALRFSAEEAHSLLSRYHRSDIGTEEAVRITAATEGWAAGLQLAALSLQHGTDPAILLTEISGRHHAVGEFLTENVLDTLDPALVDFMMATSITRQICADLANALTTGDRGQAVLETIEERNLFLRRIDEEGTWFRYYRLFADFLRQRLERDQPQRLPDLHRAATRWFASHGMISEAVGHALHAKDHDLAMDLAENAGIELMEQGQMARVLALVDTIPADAAATRPGLQLMTALANLTLRKTSAARAALDRLRAMTELSDGTAADAARLRAHCELLDAITAMMADRVVDDELLTAVPDEAAPLEPWYPAGVAVVSAFAALARCDYVAARTCRERAAAYLENATGPFTETYAYCLSGIAAHEQLDIDAAEYYLRKAYQVATRGRSSPGMAARLAGALLGELLYERDELDAAEQLLDQALDPTPTAGTVDFFIAIYVAGAKVKAARHDLAAADARLAAGMSLAEQQSLPRLAASIVGERLRLGITGRPTEAVEEPSNATPLLRDLHRTNTIRYTLGNAPGPIPLEEARSLVETLAARGRARALITAEALLARCLWDSGQRDTAIRELAPTATRCRELGLLRVLRDEGAEPILATMN